MTNFYSILCYIFSISAYFSYFHSDYVFLYIVYHMRIPAQARNSCHQICTRLVYSNVVQMVLIFAIEESFRAAFERYRLVYTALFQPHLKLKGRAV